MLKFKTYIGFWVILIGLLNRTVISEQVHTFLLERDGLKFECRNSLSKNTFLLLENVKGEFWMKNISPKIVKFNFSKPYWWTIHDENGKIYRHPDVPIPLLSFELKPGDSIGGKTLLARSNYDEKNMMPVDSSWRNPFFPMGKYRAFFGPDTVPFVFNVIINPASKIHQRKLLFWEFAETHQPGRYFFDTTLDVPNNLEGPLYENPANSNAVDLAFEFFEKNKAMFGLNDPRSELKADRKRLDKKFGDIVDFNQLYKGVPISEAGIRTYSSSTTGKLREVSGALHPDINILTTPRIDKKFAILKALRDLKLPSNYKSREMEYRGNGEPSTTLIVLPFEGKYFLTWCVGIYIDNSANGWEYFIDSNSGKIIYKSPTAQLIF